MLPCAYCGRLTNAEPYVDTHGIGHLPTCFDDECAGKAWVDTVKQRDAKKRADASDADTTARSG